ncbi:serine/arginine repetitive matrix protein 1-like [Stegodyphus dumicola]|uniref:serine/arginine repetitive matrix protein 1-like n=1 Tax=Stegodyphus dumicola TaxID=202533 RepID=UPI0015A99B88|nr:serine/arginine repetitive matrix protein 1-like [Stegodyphus dumicola]
MELLRLVVFVIVLCAVIGNTWAQNRGSVRYVPPEEYDGESRRAQHPPPTRGSSTRRQRPTKAPESSVLDEEHQVYQPPPNRERTSFRRNPTRDALPQSIPVRNEEKTRFSPTTVKELPHITTAAPEGRPQGRRRRPKKRRRPQAAVAKATEGQNLEDPSSDKVSELLDSDQKRSQPFHGSTESRSAPTNLDSDPSYQLDPTLWANNKFDESISNPTGTNAGSSQYYPPEPATNRLPVEDSGRPENSQRYPQSSPDPTNTRYVPPQPETSIPNRASYVPVLPPVRNTAAEISHLPHEDYSEDRGKDAMRHTISLDRSNSQRPPADRSPSDPRDLIWNSGIKPAQNDIHPNSESAVPTRGHSDVRLPQNEQPLLAPDLNKNFDSSEEVLRNLQHNERPEADVDSQEISNPTNRLPNPSVTHYDSVYPSYTDENLSNREESNFAPHRRQETVPTATRNSVSSRSQPQIDESTRPKDDINDANIGGRQISRYQPPLQRAGSRYRPEDSERTSSSRDQTNPTDQPAYIATRGRGSVRQQSGNALSKSRGSSRHQAERSTETPVRTRNTQPHDYDRAPTRTRGTQRYQPDPTETGSRVSSRRQPVNLNSGSDTVHAPVAPAHRQRLPVHSDTVAEDHQPARPSVNTRYEPSALTLHDAGDLKDTLRSEPEYEIRDYNAQPHLEDAGNLRSLLRTSPQAEVRNHEQPYVEEPAEEHNDRNKYVPEYHTPRVRTRNENFDQQRNSPREQPERSRTNRNQHTPSQLPQYQEPQNPRVDRRQQTARTQSRQQSRSRHEEPIPQTVRSSGGAKFSCPDPFGFFADPIQCDKYYECRNGTAVESLCNDGLAFNEISAPKYLRCDSLRDVDCSSRPQLQEARPTKNCPRRNGLFPHETDCTKFWNCVDGTATEVQCPPGLTYSDERATCDWADLVKSSCKSEDLLGFTCPEPTAHDLQDGVYSRYPHPSNCRLHFTCIKGKDGLRRPRMLSCTEGLVFDPVKGSCSRPDEVPGCEDFYGSRSPPPKRKPSRQPVPVEPEEELEEVVTPRPRRRGQNRRTRN